MTKKDTILNIILKLKVKLKGKMWRIKLNNRYIQCFSMFFVYPTKIAQNKRVLLKYLKIYLDTNLKVILFELK